MTPQMAKKIARSNMANFKESIKDKIELLDFSDFLIRSEIYKLCLESYIQGTKDTRQFESELRKYFQPID